MVEQRAPRAHSNTETSNQAATIRINFVRTMGNSERFAETKKTVSLQKGNLTMTGLQYSYFPLIYTNPMFSRSLQDSTLSSLVPGFKRNRANLVCKEFCLPTLKCLLKN